MTRKFRVESGVALVSEQEFENFRLKIINECAQAAKDFADHLDGVPRYYVQEAVAKILALNDKKPESKP